MISVHYFSYEAYHISSLNYVLIFNDTARFEITLREHLFKKNRFYHFEKKCDSLKKDLFYNSLYHINKGDLDPN